MKSLLPALTFLFFISCSSMTREKIKGSGKIISENRTYTAFNGIDVSSSFNVYVKEDSVYSVRFEGDDNLMPYIESRQKGEVLIIKFKDNTGFDATQRMKVYVTAPLFRRLYASGACNLYGQGVLNSNEIITVNLHGASNAELELKSPVVHVEVSGAGSAKLKGSVKDLVLSGTGSSSLECGELLTENTDLHISGAGNAEVHASVKLDVNVTGAGNVRYRGNPAVTQNISGAGSVKKID